MINKFQKRGLGILRDILQIDPLRIPDQVELTDFTGVDFDFVQNCAVSARPHFAFSSPPLGPPPRLRQWLSNRRQQLSSD